jgi:hypothetical protein
VGAGLDDRRSGCCGYPHSLSAEGCCKPSRRRPFMARAPRSRGQGGGITESTATGPDDHVEFDFGYDFGYLALHHSRRRLDFHGPTRTELTIAHSSYLPDANEMSSSSSVNSESTAPVSKLKKRKRESSDSSSSSEPGGTEDVAVLSHAAKRKERKAVLKKALARESPAKKEKKEEHATRPLKRENSIWVGNLSYKTTPESLRRFFDGIGEVTRVHLPTKLGKASPGDPARRENRG